MIKRVLQDGWALDRAKTEAEAIGLAALPLEAETFTVLFSVEVILMPIDGPT